MLLVGVHGPRTPCEEILVKHVGSRLYSVSYLLKDKGEYTLVVKWGWLGCTGAGAPRGYGAHRYHR